MLSEENEIAILELEQLVEKSRDLREEDFYTIFTIHKVQNIATVLNIVTKLQKENEEKDKEIETLKRDFKIVDQECSRLERKEAKQDKII